MKFGKGLQEKIKFVFKGRSNCSDTIYAEVEWKLVINCFFPFPIFVDFSYFHFYHIQFSISLTSFSLFYKMKQTLIHPKKIPPHTPQT